MLSTIPAPVAASGMSASVPSKHKKMTTQLPSVFIIVLRFRDPALNVWVESQNDLCPVSVAKDGRIYYQLF